MNKREASPPAEPETSASSWSRTARIQSILLRRAAHRLRQHAGKIAEPTRGLWGTLTALPFPGRAAKASKAAGDWMEAHHLHASRRLAFQFAAVTAILAIALVAYHQFRPAKFRLHHLYIAGAPSKADDPSADNSAKGDAAEAKDSSTKSPADPPAGSTLSLADDDVKSKPKDASNDAQAFHRDSEPAAVTALAPSGSPKKEDEFSLPATAPSPASAQPDNKGNKSSPTTTAANDDSFPVLTPPTKSASTPSAQSGDKTPATGVTVGSPTSSLAGSSDAAAQSAPPSGANSETAKGDPWGAPAATSTAAATNDSAVKGNGEPKLDEPSVKTTDSQRGDILRPALKIPKFKGSDSAISAPDAPRLDSAPELANSPPAGAPGESKPATGDSAPPLSVPSQTVAPEQKDATPAKSDPKSNPFDELPVTAKPVEKPKPADSQPAEEKHDREDKHDGSPPVEHHGKGHSKFQMPTPAPSPAAEPSASPATDSQSLPKLEDVPSDKTTPLAKAASQNEKPLPVSQPNPVPTAGFLEPTPAAGTSAKGGPRPAEAPVANMPPVQDRSLEARPADVPPVESRRVDPLGPSDQGQTAKPEVQSPASLSFSRSTIEKSNGSLRYQIVVRNNGAHLVKQVEIDEPIWPDHTVQATDPPSESRDARLHWTLQNIPPHDEQTITVTLSAPAAVSDPFPPRHEHGGPKQPDSAVNGEPRLVLELIAPSVVRAGEPCRVGFRATNHGVRIAGLKLDLDLPAQLRFHRGQQLQYKLGALDENESREDYLTAIATGAGTSEIRGALILNGFPVTAAKVFCRVTGSRSGAELAPSRNGGVRHASAEELAPGDCHCSP